MKDQISIQRVAGLHPLNIDSCTRAINASETKLGPYACVRIVQGTRTFDVQDHLYEIGRTVKGANARPGHPMGDIVTKAKGGQSPHNYGLAVDFCILYDKDHNGTFESLSWDTLVDLNMDGESDWHEVVDCFKAEGWAWGGDWVGSFKDNPHVEKLFGYSEDCSGLLVKYNAKDFIPGTQFVNIAA